MGDQERRLFRNRDIAAALKAGTTALGSLLLRSEGASKLSIKHREELVFHVAEIVLDVALFLDSDGKSDAVEHLFSNVEFHWPYHFRKALRLLRLNTMRETRSSDARDARKQKRNGQRRRG